MASQPQESVPKNKSMQALEVAPVGTLSAQIASVPGVGTGTLTYEGDPGSRWACPPTPQTWPFMERVWSQGSQSRCPLMRCFPSLKVPITRGSTDSVRVSNRRPGDFAGAGGECLQFKEESEGRSLLAWV